MTDDAHVPTNGLDLELGRRTFLGLVAGATAITLTEWGGIRSAAAQTMVPLALSPTAPSAQARYLIDEAFFFLDKADLPRASVWDFDQAGGETTNAYSSWFRIRDTSPTLPVTLYRPFLSQSSGTLVLEFRFRPLSASMEGTRWKLRDGTSDVLELVVASNSLRLKTPTGTTGLIGIVQNAEFGVRVTIDLTAWTVGVDVNGKSKAVGSPLLGVPRAVDNLAVSTDAGGTTNMYFGPVRLWRDFILNETFASTTNNNTPDLWAAGASNATLAVIETWTSYWVDRFCLQAAPTTGAGGTITLPLGTAAAASSAHDLIAEAKFRVTSGGEGFEFGVELADGTRSALAVRGGSLVVEDDDGTPRGSRPHAAVWTHVRLALDLTTSTLTVLVNGKTVADAVPAFAGVASTANPPSVVRFTLPAGTQVLLDDVYAYVVEAAPTDYVPAPTPVGTGELTIVVSEFGGWRTGYHLGWDLITRFPERKPVLGWYDEGNPEVSDWETKWMLENGISCRLHTWLRPGGPLGNPIKLPYVSHALHDGYFPSRYSDQIDFAILWENVSGGATSSADFRTVLVPYWIEYYFSDPRYLVIDNKPVFAIYRTGNLVTTFGSASAAQAEISYLRAAVQAAGFDDLIILTTSVTADSASIGIDAEYAYSREGYFELQSGAMEDRRDTSPLDVLPTICVGRDDRGWDGPFGEFASQPTYEAIAEWVRDDFIPSLPTGSLGRKLVILGNWNEYGEGHFISPTGLTGFGYLNTIRDTFGTSLVVPSNTLPSTSQLNRLEGLHPPGRTLPPVAAVAPAPSTVFHAEWDFDTDGDLEGWTVDKQVDGLVALSGAMRGSSTTFDPGLLSPDGLGIPAAEAPFVRIRMNGTPTLGAEFYFITDQDPIYTQSKGARFFAERNGNPYGQIDLPLWKLTTWNGTIRQIRIDPIIAPGTFEIDYVGIMNVPMTGDRIVVDGVLQGRVRPTVSAGVPFVPIEQLAPMIGVRRGRRIDDSGVHLIRGSTVVIVTTGSTVATVSGAPVALAAAAFIDPDGRFLLPASLLHDAFGFTVTWAGGSGLLEIST